MTLAAGTKLGPYEIVAPIGAGGMGEVYRAKDTRLGRDVAIKVLPANLAATPEVRARFDREARAVSSLNHPNICTLFDVGHQEGIDFLVMEHLEGETLAARLARGALPSADLLRCAIEIAEALDAAHRAGIVHRDLKPGNVMLTKTGTKLLDFGLARATGLGGADAADVTRSPTVSRPLTAEGTIVGTFQYMSPEQLEGGEADARSDLFAFGAVLYEMATGKRAFEGKSQASLIAAILDKDPPPISAIAPLVPPALDRVVQRCLAKKPDDRWQTARDLASELRWIRDDSSHAAAPASSATPASSAASAGGAQDVKSARNAAAGRRLGVALAIVAAGLAATKQVIRLVKPRPPKLNEQMTLRTLTLPLTQIGYPGMSQDGKWIALPAADATGKWDVYFMNVNGTEVRRVTSDSGYTATYADVSPDGSLIAYDTTSPVGVGEIRVVSSLGGTSRRVSSHGGSGPHWSPDGRRIGYQIGPFTSGSGHLELWSVQADGSDERLDYVDSLSSGGNRISFSWSPDGKKIAWLRGFPGPAEELVVRTLATGEEHQLTHEGKNIDEVCWTRQNEIVFSSNRGGNTNLWMVRSSGGPIAQVTKGIGPDIGMRISSDGKTLLYLQRQNVSHVWIAEFESRSARQITHEDQLLGAPSFSPDRQRIVVPILSTDPLKPGGFLFVMNRDGSGRRQITFGKELPISQSWSPDGTRICYAARTRGVPGDSTFLHLVDVENPRTPERIGRGQSAFWRDDSTLYVAHRTHGSTLSLRGNVESGASEESTFVIPVSGKPYDVLFDIHRSRLGIWIQQRSSAGGLSERQIFSFLKGDQVFDFNQNRNAIFGADAAGNIVRVTLPDGERLPVPGNYPGLVGNGGTLSRDEKEMVYVVTRAVSKLVLIENLR